MANLVFGLNQSWTAMLTTSEFVPGPSLFRHFTEQVRDLAGSVYGRRMYQVMRYWEEDRPERDAEERDSRRRGGANRSGSCRARRSPSAPTPHLSRMTSRR